MCARRTRSVARGPGLPSRPVELPVVPEPVAVVPVALADGSGLPDLTRRQFLWVRTMVCSS